MKILVLNAGSSSLKYQVIDMSNETVLCKGLVDRIGLNTSNFIHTVDGVTHKYEIKVPDHSHALQHVFKELMHEKHPVIKDMSEINAIGHRVLHTGESFNSSILVTDETFKIMEGNIELGPLHMPANLSCIKSCRELTNVPNIAVFDTAFHMTMPKYAYMYGVDYNDYKDFHVRRYGFHGTSHKFVSSEAIKYLNKKNLKIVTCHLGNGSSITAVNNGESVDTSMGFTPLEGLIMGTRSGSLDPAILEYLMKKKNMTIEEITNYLNKKCGFLGISGISSDTRDLYDAAEKGNERAQLAIDIFCYMIKKYIGSYAAAMGGLDVVVFTGGIGENCVATRKQVLENLEFMGIELDQNKNNQRPSGILEVSKDSSKVKVLVIPTNEELVIARDTKEIVENIK